jgi:hypothetical protein
LIKWHQPRASILLTESDEKTDNRIKMVLMPKLPKYDLVGL